MISVYLLLDLLIYSFNIVDLFLQYRGSSFNIVVQWR